MNLLKLTSLRIGHDGKGFGSGWFLDRVQIVEASDPDTIYHFNCEKCVYSCQYFIFNPALCFELLPPVRWLDEGEDDGKIERVLPLTEIEEVPPGNGELVLLQTCKLENTGNHSILLLFCAEMWTVSIETATPRADAGDGRPSPDIDCVGRLVIALYGEKGGSDDMPLLNDVDAGQRLKPNQTEVFKV